MKKNYFLTISCSVQGSDYSKDKLRYLLYLTQKARKIEFELKNVASYKNLIINGKLEYMKI